MALRCRTGIADPTQADADGDGVGDACDRCPGVDDVAFPANADGDARLDACDCAPDDRGLWGVPFEHGDEGLTVRDSPHPDFELLVEWGGLMDLLGSATLVDLAMGELGPAGDPLGPACLLVEGRSHRWKYVEDAPGDAWFLLRSHSACGDGGWGGEPERVARAEDAVACP